MFDDPVAAGVLLGERCLEQLGGVVEAELAVAELGDQVAGVGRRGGEDVVEFDEAVVALDVGSHDRREFGPPVCRGKPGAIGDDGLDHVVPLLAGGGRLGSLADAIATSGSELVAGDHGDAVAPGLGADGVGGCGSDEGGEPVGSIGDQRRGALVDLVPNRSGVQAAVAGIDAVVGEGAVVVVDPVVERPEGAIEGGLRCRWE